MKNQNHIFLFILLSFLLACDKNTECLSPYNDCNCAEGYEGDNCNTRITEKFLGKYKLEDAPTSDTIGMTVLDSTALIKQVYFKKFNYRSDYIGDFYGIVDGEHVIIPKQTPTGVRNFQSIEGDVCLNKEITPIGLIFRVKIIQGNSSYNLRTVYLKK